MSGPFTLLHFPRLLPFPYTESRALSLDVVDFGLVLLVEVVVERVDLGRGELPGGHAPLKQQVKLSLISACLAVSVVVEGRTSAKVLPVGSGTRKYA